MSESNRIINNICAKGYYCLFITRMFSTFTNKIIKAPIYYYLDVYHYIYYYIDFYCYIYYYLNISVLFLTIYPTRYFITHIFKEHVDIDNTANLLPISNCIFSLSMSMFSFSILFNGTSSDVDVMNWDKIISSSNKVASQSG